MSFADAPIEFDDQGRILVQRPINWNVVDEVDKMVWDKLTSQFWLPEKVALSNDLKTWHQLTPEEQDATSKVFIGLSGLDTLQGHVGAPALVQDATTQHEVAIYNNIAFMEEVHSKTYSSTSATFLTTEENEKYFRWFAENECTQYKVKTIIDFYYGKDPLMKKAASTLLESFLFYSGFYMPMHWSSVGKLSNTADLIRLILKDEAVHGYYIGWKFQVGYNKLTKSEQTALKDKVFDLLYLLYDNELKYTEEIYDPLGLTEDVKKFLHYNANKALQNLGFESLFPKEETNVNPAILSALTLTSETHDFFSSSGSSYTMGITESTTDDDWD